MECGSVPASRGALPPIASVDDILHRERVGRGGGKATFRAQLGMLPDGCMVFVSERAYLVLGKHLHRWSPTGYTRSLLRTSQTHVSVLTPRSIVAALAAGYAPQIHESAVDLGE